MRSVLISIQPYWVFLIIAKTMGWNIEREKTVEVRKTFPKDENWNKVAKIYCSKDKNSFAKIPSQYKPLMEQFLGKVIGEFVCNEIINIFADEHCAYFHKTCLTNKEFDKYCDGLPCVKGWRISDLVIYDKPKELSEFITVDKEAIKQCEHRERVYQNPDYVNGAWLFGGYVCNKGEIDWCCDCKRKPLKRPPQSWCYVENDFKE